EDAAVVVIARPAARFGDAAVKALRSYMNPPGEDAKKGKLLVLLDVVTTNEGTMVQTGLEPLLEEFNVQAKDNRILSLGTNRPGTVLVWPNLDSRNPIATAFVSPDGFIQQFAFNDVREIQSRKDPAGGASRYTVENVLVAPVRYGNFVETNLRADA